MSLRLNSLPTVLVLGIVVAVVAAPAAAQVAEVNEQTAVGNKPERVEWFARLGFGIFIHWSVDSQLGSVISHSLVGADEDYIWLTRKRGENTVYAIVTRPDWKWGSRRECTLQSVKAGEKTTVSVLGQTSKVLEYQPGADVAVRWKQGEQGLHVSAVRAQRIYNDRKWPGPVVIKVTDAHPALAPPAVITKGAQASGNGKIALHGELVALGKVPTVKVGFQYRRAHDHTQPLATADPWHDTELVERTAPGRFSIDQPGLDPGRYDFRAVVVHPRIKLHGDRKGVTAR